MRPRVYNFTRSFVETLDLVNNPGVTPPAGWTITADAGMVRGLNFNLAQLPDITDFTNLYSQYRINAVKAEFYFSNTSSETTQTELANRQILLMLAPNRVGRQDTILTEQHFLCTPASKKRLCLNSTGRPVTVYMKLSQLSERYAGVGNTDYTAVKPQFISTGEINTPHYGMDIRFQRVDNAEFSQDATKYPKVKCVYKVYLQCKQVQ